MIKTKNILGRSLPQASLQASPAELENLKQKIDQLKAQIKDSILDHKLQKRSKLRSKLLRADPSRKRFWRFLKGQIKSAGHTTALKNQASSPIVISWKSQLYIINKVQTGTPFKQNFKLLLCVCEETPNIIKVTNINIIVTKTKSKTTNIYRFAFALFPLNSQIKNWNSDIYKSSKQVVGGLHKPNSEGR